MFFKYFLESLKSDLTGETSFNADANLPKEAAYYVPDLDQIAGISYVHVYFYC